MAIHLDQERVHPESCQCKVNFPGLVNTCQTRNLSIWGCSPLVKLLKTVNTTYCLWTKQQQHQVGSYLVQDVLKPHA